MMKLPVDYKVKSEPDIGLERKLAACQANNKRIREAITYELAHHSFRTELSDALQRVLDQPTDDTALKAAIQHGIADFLERTGQYVTNDAIREATLAAEREKERERICVAFKPPFFELWDELSPKDVVKAIRALGDSE